MERSGHVLRRAGVCPDRRWMFAEYRSNQHLDVGNEMAMCLNRESARKWTVEIDLHLSTIGSAQMHSFWSMENGFFERAGTATDLCSLQGGELGWGWLGTKAYPSPGGKLVGR